MPTQSSYKYFKSLQANAIQAQLYKIILMYKHYMKKKIECPPEKLVMAIYLINII